MLLFFFINPSQTLKSLISQKNEMCILFVIEEYIQRDNELKVAQLVSFLKKLFR